MHFGCLEPCILGIWSLVFVLVIHRFHRRPAQQHLRDKLVFVALPAPGRHHQTVALEFPDQPVHVPFGAPELLGKDGLPDLGVGAAEPVLQAAQHHQQLGLGAPQPGAADIRPCHGFEWPLRLHASRRRSREPPFATRPRRVAWYARLGVYGIVLLVRKNKEDHPLAGGGPRRCWLHR
jgi:hypothetical protein